MKQAAVIGSPISHSRSPAIFSFVASRLGIADFRYSAREVRPEGLSAFLAALRREPESVGLNVTIPHKEAILAELDAVSAEARAVGAANVVHQESPGKLKGHNTDVIGVARTLEEQGCRMQGGAAWVWGAGGAARAVAYALGQAGAARVHLFNRDRDRAGRLASEFAALFPATRFEAVSDPRAPLEVPLRLAVNSTSVGMAGTGPVGGLFAELGRLDREPGALAFDLVYNPEHTPFLDLADHCGYRTVGGLDMLIYQALATWEIWFGPLERAGGLKAELSAYLRTLLNWRGPEQPRPVFLAGFMGSGKSTVGTLLARRLGWKFVDTDDLVEKEAGLTVAEIFARDGEPRFRALERQAVECAASMRRTVVSLGGGALMDPETLRLVEASGHLVYLSARPSTLQERLRATSGKRPLLAGLGPRQQEERIAALLAERLPIYCRARTRIETDGLGADQVADLLQSEIEKLEQEGGRMTNLQEDR